MKTTDRDGNAATHRNIDDIFLVDCSFSSGVQQ